jgi:hypothetical protein
MRTAIRRRDGVAVGIEKAVGIRRPTDRPLRAAMGADLAGAAGENIRMHQSGAGERLGEIILQAVGEMEHRLFGHPFDAAQELLGA